MKYQDFKKMFADYPYFSSSLYGGITNAPRVLQNQVDKWVKKGQVVKLRRGLYTLGALDRKTGLSTEVIANILYQPSYVSLEFALQYYDMIPEGVYLVTSVTPKKTAKFSNPLGNFRYQSVRKSAFFGYVSVKDVSGSNFLIATPEKALIDYLYFHVPAAMRFKEDYFDESMRLQNAELIDVDKFEEYAARMGSVKLTKISKVFAEWAKKNR